MPVFTEPTLIRDVVLVLVHAFNFFGTHAVDKKVQAVYLAMLQGGAVFGFVHAAAEPSEHVPDHNFVSLCKFIRCGKPKIYTKLRSHCSLCSTLIDSRVSPISFDGPIEPVIQPDPRASQKIIGHCLTTCAAIASYLVYRYHNILQIDIQGNT